MHFGQDGGGRDAQHLEERQMCGTQIDFPATKRATPSPKIGLPARAMDLDAVPQRPKPTGPSVFALQRPTRRPAERRLHPAL